MNIAHVIYLFIKYCRSGRVQLLYAPLATELDGVVIGVSSKEAVHRGPGNHDGVICEYEVSDSDTEKQCNVPVHSDGGGKISAMCSSGLASSKHIRSLHHILREQH